jgi:hypothetical protein
MLQEFSDPLAILDIGLAPGHGFDVLRIHQHHRKLTFENVPDGLPVDASRLHRHMSHVLALQPVGQFQQVAVIVPKRQISWWPLPLAAERSTQAVMLLL